MEKQETTDKKEPVLVQYIKDRVENKNKNFVMLFVGATGSGKSLAGLKLAETIDPSFNIDRVNFKAKDFMNTINNLVAQSEKEEIKGKVIMWDEFGVEHNAREFMTISNRVINYFFQTSRHLNLIVIMTVPLLSFIDSSTRKLSHAVAEMQSINSREKVATAKVKMIQTNVMTGKEYPKYLRYKRNNKQYKTTKLRFKLPSSELLEAYEKKKKAFTTQLNLEIMNKLLKSEEKENRDTRELTNRQKEITLMLKESNVEQVAEKLKANISTIYEHKKAIEKKGVVFKPIWQDKRIIGHDIDGFGDNSPIYADKPQYQSHLLEGQNQKET